MRAAAAGVLAGCLLVVASCAIRHVTPYQPDVEAAPQTADGVAAGSDCFDSATAADAAICAAPALGAANRTMILALHGDLRRAGLFGRDALLASQRVWLLGLPGACHLPALPAPAGAEGQACLARALMQRAAVLQAWQPPPARASVPDAVAQYVRFRPIPRAAGPWDPAFCADVAGRANAALRRTGDVDPAAMGGAEVAGSHGPAAIAGGGLSVAVDLYDANVFGLFQRRARSLSLDGGAPVITPLSLTRLAQAWAAANQGGRFSDLASATGDYGGIDVFRLDGRALVLASDPWGSTAPAAPGEAAHAGLWQIAGPVPVPLCLFDIYLRPADPGSFGGLADFAAWRDLLDAVRDGAALPLGGAALRDQARLAADTRFTLLHMPLLALQHAKAGGWTPWLRHRHDAVLDALFAWSTAGPANHAQFQRIFALLRPAAADLVRAYQSTEGLSGAEATEAAGLTIMEMLYLATVTIAPEVGSYLGAPADAAGSTPRYPILAVP
jgi:hypothetical protein